MISFAGDFESCALTQAVALFHHVQYLSSTLTVRHFSRFRHVATTYA